MSHSDISTSKGKCTACAWYLEGSLCEHWKVGPGGPALCGHNGCCYWESVRRPPVRVIVCGGRDFADREAVYRALDRLNSLRRIVELIEGGAPGADRMAADWAAERLVKLTEVRAEWDRYGPSAGPKRNRKMLELKPDGVVAFPGGRGTMDMIRAATEAGVPVWHPEC